jgi:cellulose synthase operon protein C
MTSLWKRPRTDAAALIFGVVVACSAVGQPADQPNVYLSVSVDAKQKMQLLDGFVQQKNWTEAVELLQSLAEKQGDRLAPTTLENPSLFINLRTYCNARLAALPPEALATYRARVDGQAEDLWRQWNESKNERALERIADEFFCSTVAPKAIDRLGDRSFSRGLLADAVGWWMKLLPREWSVGRIDDYPELKFRCPTPPEDVSRIVAKCILAKSLAGDSTDAKRLLAFLRVKHPQAKGRLAGAEGIYVEVLSKILDSPQMTAPPASNDYPTFGGDERRNKSTIGKADVGGLQFLWDFDVEANASERDESPINDFRLPNFPAVIGDAVYTASESAVWKFDLKTGKATRWLDYAAGRNGSEPSKAKYSVTIKGSRLYVTVYDSRGGMIENRPRRFGGPRRDWHNVNSTLICFDLTTQKEAWRKTPSDFGADRGAVFEGSPLAIDDDVCIAVTRYDAMSETSILRVDSSGNRVVWKAVVCESMAESGVADPPMYNLLSLGDSTIYYCTNLGAVAAVRADDGRLQWVATYTRRAPATTAPGDPSIPDINPCVVHQGRVYALPRDGRRLICYDAQTGEKLWESPASLAFAHILGAHDGVVVATGSRVCGFDAASGKLRWMRPSNSTPGFGRGILSGGDVYWPTRTDIHVFDVKTGDLARPPIELFSRLGHRPGNLLHAGDYLLVAQSHRLLAFCSFSKLIERHRKEITANPDSPEPRYKLGDALLQRGEFASAAEAFADAAERAGPLRIVEGKNFAEAAKDRRFDALLALAEKQKPEQATAAFSKAFEAARTPDQRVKAQTKEYDKADAKRQVAICQNILDRKELRSVSLTRDGASEHAGKWAARNLHALIARHGRDVYAKHEAEFAKELAAAKDSPATLLELGERFPLAATAMQTLQTQAEAALKRGDAANAEKLAIRWLASSQSVGDQNAVRRSIEILVKSQRALGRIEAAYLWAASLSRTERGNWPDRPPIRRIDFDLRLGDGAANIAMRSASVGVDPSKFDVQSVARGGSTELRWTPSASTSAKEIITTVPGTVSWIGRAANGLVVAAGAEMIFFGDKDPQKPLWKKRLREVQRFKSLVDSAKKRPMVPAPSSTRFLLAGDLVIAAADNVLTAVDLSTGEDRWRTDAAASSERPPSLSLVDATLFIETESGTNAYDPMTGRVLFSTATRIMSAAASKELLAVADRTTIEARDQRTGEVRWKRTLANPTARDPILVGDDDSVFVVEDGAQLAALETKRGTVLWRTALAWGPATDVAAAAGQGSVCVFAGGTLECWDSKTGDRRWRRRDERGELGDRWNPSLTIGGDRAVVAARGSDVQLQFALKNGDMMKP